MFVRKRFQGRLIDGESAMKHLDISVKLYLYYPYVYLFINRLYGIIEYKGMRYSSAKFP